MFPRVTLAVLALTSQVAYAQPAEADAAFQRGRRLMAEGKTAEACDAFTASMKLDPTNGTLYNLGVCHEKLGKLASAWSELDKVAKTDTNKQRAQDAAKRVAALAPRLVRMRLVVAEPVDGLVVERNGIDVTALVGEPVPVDPGSYEFAISAPQRPRSTFTVDLSREGETIDVAIPTTSTPAEVPAPPAPVAAYPMQLALRPLVLPARWAELSLDSSIATDAYVEQAPIDARLRARYSFGRVELRADLASHVRYAEVTAKRPNPLQQVGLAAAYALTPMIAGDIGYTRYHPISDVGKGSDFRAGVTRKHPLTPRLAVEARGGFTYAERTYSDMAYSEFSLDADAAVQAIATPRLGIEVSTTIDLNLGGDLYGHTFGLAVALRAMYAMNPSLDLYASVLAGLLPAPADSTSSGLRVLTMGASWRPL